MNRVKGSGVNSLVYRIGIEKCKFRKSYNILGIDSENVMTFLDFGCFSLYLRL